MIRWLRTSLVVVAVLLVLAAGLLVGLLLVANSGYTEIRIHDWLRPVFDPLLAGRALEVQMPALLAGWLLAVLAGGGLVAASLFYAWRRRQYESLVRRLERELVKLRNLPFTDPAPLEDLPERPDRVAAAELDDAMADIFGMPRSTDREQRSEAADGSRAP